VVLGILVELVEQVLAELVVLGKQVVLVELEKQELLDTLVVQVELVQEVLVA
jgi:hypothetical protein